MWVVGDLATPEGRQLARDAVQFVVSDDDNDYVYKDTNTNNADDIHDEDNDDEDDNEDEDQIEEQILRWLTYFSQTPEGQRMALNAMKNRVSSS